jgi:hypothetical protein
MLPGAARHVMLLDAHLKTISSHGEDEHADSMAALGHVPQPAADVGDDTSATEPKAGRSYVGGDIT